MASRDMRDTRRKKTMTLRSKIPSLDVKMKPSYYGASLD
jgi:hypothetical protein